MARHQSQTARSKRGIVPPLHVWPLAARAQHPAIPAIGYQSISLAAVKKDDTNRWASLYRLFISITSSALTSSVEGTSKPSAFASSATNHSETVFGEHVGSGTAAAGGSRSERWQDVEWQGSASDDATYLEGYFDNTFWCVHLHGVIVSSG